MLTLQGDGGIILWPKHEVASLQPEVRGRWRAVHRSGQVGHRPGPIPQGPWLPLAEGFVNPNWMVQEEGGYRDPAGFWWPGKVEGDIAAEPASPMVGDFPFSVAEVRWLSKKGGEILWHTDRGDFPAVGEVEPIVKLYAELIQFSAATWVNSKRLRAVQPWEGEGVRLTLDTGEVLQERPAHSSDFAARLGLANLSRLLPYDAALQRWPLRDYPYEIASASSQQLQVDFADPNCLMACQIWQAVRYRQQGQACNYGDKHRAFWYVPMAPTLHRGGWLRELDPHEIDREGSPSHIFYRRFLEMVADMIGQDRLFRFADLGFTDQDAHLRQIGTARPEVVVYAEKGSLKAGLSAIAARYGVTTLQGSGLPELLQSEYLSEALRAVTRAPLRIVGYVDYDVSGWTAARAFGKQLQGLGHELAAPVHMLLRAEDFSAEEQELYALPCPSATAGQREMARKWVAEGGGLNGQALGIHSDYVRPVERVLAAFERWWRHVED